jgi:CheY-like chemotaxis protein
MSATVLLIDDDLDLLPAMEATLHAMSPFQVTVARDGVEGLEQVEADCVVVDVRMPHLDGLQFVRAMRGDPATADIPIVILSAMKQEHDIVRGFLAGTDRYVPKPVEPEDLVEIIAEVLTVTVQERLRHLQALAEEEPA